jgi:hypothetical protein
MPYAATVREYASKYSTIRSKYVGYTQIYSPNMREYATDIHSTPLRICVWIWLYCISDSVIKLPHHVAHLCGNYSENRSQIGEKIRGTACAVEQSSKRSSGSNNMHIRPGDLAKSNCWPQCPTEREPQFSVSVASLTKSRALRM